MTSCCCARAAVLYGMKLPKARIAQSLVHVSFFSPLVKPGVGP
jgi:hypothetical protein